MLDKSRDRSAENRTRAAGWQAILLSIVLCGPPSQGERDDLNNLDSEALLLLMMRDENRSVYQLSSTLTLFLSASEISQVLALRNKVLNSS